MKFLSPVLWVSLFLIFLSGCEGKTETIGNLPDIKVSGSVLNGALSNAEVIIVGIDVNGQPEKVETNEVLDYSGERLYTDENGEFSGYFNGAYSGPVLIVVRARTDEDGGDTQMRCLLQAGCRATDGSAVNFGDQYVVPDSFEIWGMDVGVKQGDRIEVTWLSHIAAKLAHSTFISDGSTCTTADCNGNLVATGFITRQSTFKSNDLVKNLFLFNASPITTLPYNPVKGSSEEDTVLLAQQAGVGLVSLLLEQVAKENGESLQQALKRIEDEFLSHKGQFYQDRAATTDLSLKYFLTSALNEAQAIQTNERSNSGVDQFVGELQTQLTGEFTQDALTTAAGADYIANIDEQITEAKAFIQNAQVWIDDIGAGQYESYFGSEVAPELTRFEGLWQNFKPALNANLQALYELQINFVEYAMTCIRGGLNQNRCDTSHVIHSNASFDSANARLTYVDGETELVAKIETLSQNEDYFYQVTFTKDAVVETSTGRVFSGLDTQDETRGYAQVGLNKTLAEGEDPYIVAMSMYYPGLTIRAKNNDGSCCNNAIKLSGEDVLFSVVGTKDVTVADSPVHYNLLALNLSGDLSDSNDERAEVAMIVNSNASSASLYYSEQKFASLDLRVDINSFQKFARLEGADLANIDSGTNALAGWLVARSDVSTDEANPDKLLGAVAFSSSTSVSDIDSDLAEILDLPDNPVSFEIGGFTYPGGETKVIIYRDPDSTTARNHAIQCVKSKGLWSCSNTSYAEYLGCNENQSLGNPTATLLEAFNYLRDQQCIPEVTIEGRGFYVIDYTNGTSETVPFTEGQTYDITIGEPFRLQIDTSSFRLLTRFEDAKGDLLPIANLSVLAQALMYEGEPLITFSGSLTSGYQGSNSQYTNGVDWLVPYGQQNLWLAVGSGQNATARDEALAYYIQNANITLTMKAFDGLDGSDDNVGFIRYAGNLLGSIRKEGNLYVVRYLDNSWQLLASE